MAKTFYTQDNAREPEFNQALEYQKAIRNMMNKAHEAIVAEDLNIAFGYLMQIKIEAYPRKPVLYNEEVLQSEKVCRTWAYQTTKDTFSHRNFLFHITEFYTNLSTYLHHCKLIMPDKADESGAADV